jgi:RNA polymerase sigma-70 factor (ECF subfamily)
VEDNDQEARFEQSVMPHMDAAYNLARWLTRNEHDAQDIVQDAFLRAFKFFGGFRGENPRSWLLTIVRNTCYSWFEKNRKHELVVEFDENINAIEDNSQNPEALLIKGADREMVRQAMEDLPVEFREVIILRELEGMSYKEIAEIATVPVGTVMSRLARARKQLQQRLTQQLQSGGPK